MNSSVTLGFASFSSAMRASSSRLVSSSCSSRSLVDMLINKIQSSEDTKEFQKVSETMVDSIYVNAPDEIKEIYKKILWSLLMKMKVPSENARELMGGIGGRGMGYLFENMEEIDIGAQKRNTAREKQRAEAERQRADEEKQRADEEKQRADEEKQRADEEKQLKIEAEERANALEEEVQRLRKLLKSQEQK